MSTWTLHSALPPLLSTLTALLYALYILAYPPKHRIYSLFLLAIPVTYAFKHHVSLTPNASVNDTFGRFLYIWYAHMSHEIAILEFSPLGDENANASANGSKRSRVKEAYKVLFDRNHMQRSKCMSTSESAPQGEKHSYSRLAFTLYHFVKIAVLYLAMTCWYAFFNPSSFTTPSDYDFSNASFFRRLPSSLNTRELHVRFVFTFQWCVINMLTYDLYHSLFAILFVGCGLDAAEEWGLSLFGCVREAWSVRRYWGKHWHNYIYHSFSAHAKVVTRGFMGMQRGRVETRLLENGGVFVASGLMHSLVRWTQDGGDGGDVWCIAVWYAAQMLPIFVEGVVQDGWRRAKTRLGVRDGRVLGVVERMVGYVWVVGWFMWSVPKQIHTRNEWTERIAEKKKKKHLVAYTLHSRVEESG